MRGGRAGQILDGRRYRHNEPGIRALCVRLVPRHVALLALERPHGLLTKRLLDAGLTVIAVHPNQVTAIRLRYSVARGKSGSFDSSCQPSSRAPTPSVQVLVPESVPDHPLLR